jgi:dienelactone hydrolase
LALWLLAGCAHWSGPPAGRGATVELVLDGRTTRADVYRPDAGAAAGGGGAAELAVVLAHGYSRSRANMAGHAARLAQVGVLAVAPDLPYSTDEPGNARALADLVGQLRAGAFAPPVRSVVLVGFSAGGLAALLAAATPGVIGYVGLDPFDRPDHPGRRFAATLATPAALLRAAPSACNGQGVAAPWAALLPHLDADRLFEGATHCDFESPTDWICRFACGGADAARQRAIADALLQQIVAWRDAAAH